MSEKIDFDYSEHYFCARSKSKIDSTMLRFPLSVSLQLTRNCNLSCDYCSEVGDIPTPSITTIKKMVSNLYGVPRIILTGGEPLMRDDLVQIAEYAKKIQFKIISLATNGVLINTRLAQNLANFIDYVDVTIDGPRNIHNRIRGEYDAIIEGIKILENTGIDFSIVTVLYRENVDSIHYVCQISDVLGAKKLKIMTPIGKGKGKNIRSKLLSSGELFTIFEKIRFEKKRNGWKPRITLTDWKKVGEGHAILVHPNGDVVASPVPSKENCVQALGNVLEEDIESIWERYQYKENHLKKYLEITLYVC